jgi:hypothetical protein
MGIPFGYYTLIDDPKKALAEKRPFKLSRSIELTVKKCKDDGMAKTFYHMAAVYEKEGLAVGGLVYYPSDHSAGVVSLQWQRALEPEEVSA